MAPEIDGPVLTQLRAALVKQAIRQLADTHEAEDVAQDALIALCTTSASFTDLDHVAAYARRTVHNLCVDRIRRRVRYVALEDADGPYDTLEHDVVNRDVLAAVVVALAEINPAYARVLVASTDVGRNHAAIALLTGVSLRNVRHGLDRGTKALKARLVAAGHSIPAVLSPVPLRSIVARFRAAGRGRRALTGAAIVGALPALLLLLPQVLGPSGKNPEAGLTRDARAVVGSIDSVGNAPTRSHGRITTAFDPFNDVVFAHDAARLLGSTHELKNDQCVLVAAHGVCQTDPNPSYVYYTVKVPKQTGVPDIQVYGSDLPPCGSTVPDNPEITCEHAHPPAPAPVPTPIGPHTP
jgi:RNA polymerase sigma factor (sigma-70 family)